MEHSQHIFGSKKNKKMEHLLLMIGKNFGSNARLHSETGEQYYFKKGSIECKNIFALFEDFQSYSAEFFCLSDAIVQHPIFPLIKTHIDQVKRFYLQQETELLVLFLRKLIPSCLPLRYKILRSVSLCSGMLFIHDESFHPSPIPAHINGYYNFIIPLSENEYRQPLIPEDLETVASLSPSIRFYKMSLDGINSSDSNIDNGANSQKEKADLSDFISNAPKSGRLNQLHAFISILAHSSPELGFINLVKDSFTSFDCTFSTALCALCSSQNSAKFIGMLLNLLGVSNTFDHFLRTLSCGIRTIVLVTPSRDNPEYVSFINIFKACAMKWILNVQERQKQNQGSISDVLQMVCQDLNKKASLIPSIAFYILRVALTIAAYENESIALAMFLEIFSASFLTHDAIELEFKQMKSNIVDNQNDTIYSKERKIIEKTIVFLLGMKIRINFSENRVEDDLKLLYSFLKENADPFVRLVIFLNSRKYIDSPVLQSFLFSYQKYLETI